MTEPLLFDLPSPDEGTTNSRVANLGQYMTPRWVAEALVQRFFGDLTDRDVVLEPSCGRGAWLHAIPSETPAIGVEIDPELAAVARLDTGRRVIVGDFRDVDLDFEPSVITGNCRIFTTSA